MGCGKTYFSRVLSEKLELECYDLDQIIEDESNSTIPSLFNNYGEDYFRNLERKTLLSIRKPGIYATGGGIIESVENITFLQENDNFSVWIDTPFLTIFERIINSDRPLVKRLGSDKIFELWRKRCNLYSRAANVRCSNPNPTKLIEICRDYTLKSTQIKEKQLSKSSKNLIE